MGLVSLFSKADRLYCVIPAKNSGWRNKFNQPKRNSEAMQDVIRHLPAVIYEFAIYPNGQKKFHYFSPNCQEILGISQEAVLANSDALYGIIFEEDLPALIDSSSESQLNSAEWYWQGRIKHGNSVKWAEFRSNHEVLSDGTVLRRGIIQDITQRKETQKESELKYQELVEKLPIGIVIHRDGKLLFGNTQAHLILGAKKSKELLGSDVLDFVHPKHRESVRKRQVELAAGQSVPMV